MTETEWCASANPDEMIRFLGDRVSHRKMRLFAVACCRRVWHLLDADRLQPAVERIEQFADGLVTDVELAAVHHEVRQYAEGEEQKWLPDRTSCSPEICAAYRELSVAYLVAYAADVYQSNYFITHEMMLLYATQSHLAQRDAFRRSTALQEWWRLFATDKALLADLLRELVGNPFRPSTFSPDWHTDTALAITTQMYESRDFGAIPILADALQDAGCDCNEVLNHCRDATQPHTRGCWVVDLILGKS